jgi:hypothetical protein
MQVRCSRISSPQGIVRQKSVELYWRETNLMSILPAEKMNSETPVQTFGQCKSQIQGKCRGVMLEVW